jgi:hypothetical protein
MKPAAQKILPAIRIALGVVAALLVCYCGLVILNVWFLLRSWAGDSPAHDLKIRLAMTLGCIAFGVGGFYLAMWCFFGNDSSHELR